MSENHSWYLNNRATGAAAFLLAVIALLLCFAAPAARAQSGATDVRRDELVLQVLKRPYILADGILAYQEDIRYYLPVAGLSEVFGFVAETDIARGFVSGWYLDEKNSFSIDVKRGELVIKGEKSNLAAEDAFVDEDTEEIYADVSLLNKIWPLTLNIDFSTLHLDVETEQKLPFELAQEREQRRLISAAKKKLLTSATTRTDLPLVPNDYRLFSLPVLDFDSQTTWDDADKELSSQFTFNGLQDLAGFSASYSAGYSYSAGTFHPPSSARLRLDRKAYGDDTLFMGLKQVSGGDVHVRMRDLVSTGKGGRGVLVSSEPVERRIEFDEIVVEGVGTPGWEVEIYRNEQLVEFGAVDEKGEYRFENVPLNVGNNIIRTVLYGPQGQTEEYTENRQISGGLLTPGTSRFDGGFVDVDRPLLLLEKDDTPTVEGVAQSAYAARGLTRNMTVFGTYASQPLDLDEKREYASLGAMIAAFGGFGQVEAYKEMHGGQALDVRFATSIMGLRLNSQTSVLRGFESPESGFGSAAKIFENKTRLSTTVRLPFGPLGIQANIEHQKNVAGEMRSKLDLQQSVNLSGIRVTNQTSSGYTNLIHDSTNGKINATVRVRQWQLRGGLDYNVHPDGGLTGVSGEIRYKPRDSFSAAVNAQYRFLTADTSGGLQLGYDFGSFLGSFDADWTKGSGYTFALHASTSLAPFGANNAYVASSSRQAGAIPVKARVFLDKDNDGAFGDGDEPVKTASLLIDGRRTKEETGEDGNIISTGASAEGLSSVELDKGSLFDPYYAPGVPGYRTVVRPGAAPSFDFPVIETGAVEGTAFYERDGKPIPGMKLQLVGESGGVVNTTETAYDGFYTFEFVAPGTYTVRADPAYEVNVLPQSVVVTPDDLFPAGIDLLLLEQAGEEGTAGAAEEAGESSTEDAPGSEAAEGDHGEVAHTRHETPADPGTVRPAPSSTKDAGGIPHDREGAAGIAVERVRIGEHPDRVRLVLDLSAPAHYIIDSKDDGGTILVALPDSAWNAEREGRGGKNAKILEGWLAESYAEGGTWLRLRARDRMAVTASGILPPDESGGYRIYIDLQEKK